MTYVHNLPYQLPAVLVFIFRNYTFEIHFMVAIINNQLLRQNAEASNTLPLKVKGISKRNPFKQQSLTSTQQNVTKKSKIQGSVKLGTKRNHNGHI